jgi:hypothetical protein
VTMTNQNLQKVITISKEVYDLCQQVINDNNYVEAHNKKVVENEDYKRMAFPDTKLTAALRRRSMDLTRALADLRKY